MINLDFATEELVYSRCLEVDSEIRQIVSNTLASCGNRYLDDVVQETYMKAITMFTGTNIILTDFRKQLSAICEEICFEYYWAEKKNYAKPRKFIPSRNEDEASMDMYLWEQARDETGNMERRMIAMEDLSQIKQYKKKWLAYSNAIEIVGTLHLRSKAEWEDYCKSGNLIKNIPSNPHEIYHNFKTWEEWLSIHHYNFDECVNWVRNNLDIKTKEEWHENIHNLPIEVPQEPNVFYLEKGWTDWSYFLGYSAEYECYLSYKDAQKWVEDNLLLFQLTEDTWNEYVTTNINKLPTLPSNIPTNPPLFYKQTGWQTWFRWFGKQNYQRKIWPISYHECARWVKQNLALIGSKEEWDRFVQGEYPIKKPDYIPAEPNLIFKGIGWHGWMSFLPVNGRMAKYRNELFGSNRVRVEYNGEKIWVKPTSMFHDTITAVVVTAFCKAGAGAEITFNAKDIIALRGQGKENAMGRESAKQKLRNKYKLSV